MSQPITAPNRSRDAGLVVRVLEYMQARPGTVIKVETLEQDCGHDGEPARRGSIQRAMAEFAARNPRDLEVVSSGRAWAWRGAGAAPGSGGTMAIIRTMGDGTVLLEGPGGKLYRAKEMQW